MSVQDPHRGDRLPRAVGHWPPGVDNAQIPNKQITLEIEAGKLLIWTRKERLAKDGGLAILDEANVRALQGLLAAARSRMKGTGP